MSDPEESARDAAEWHLRAFVTRLDSNFAAAVVTDALRAVLSERSVPS